MPTFMRQHARCLAGCVTVLALVLLGLVYAREAPRRAFDGAEPRRLAEIRALGNRIRPLHEIKRKPRPGDWLESHVEAGQSFDAYLQESPIRPDSIRTTLYIQPLGELGAQGDRLLRLTAEILNQFYGVPVESLPPLPLDTVPARARRVNRSGGAEQILTGYVLRELKRTRPKDAVAVIALTGSDLWPGEGWNFVFGQASLQDRVGVWSFSRFGNPNQDFDRCLRRTLSTALHETGHMLSIRHCVAYECGMNGSNNLNESDRRPMAFCPECEMKVWWGCRLEPRTRYARLTAFARANGLDDEAAFWKAGEKALESKSAPR